jgi:hypothetical protein
VVVTTVVVEVMVVIMVVVMLVEVIVVVVMVMLVEVLVVVVVIMVVVVVVVVVLVVVVNGEEGPSWCLCASLRNCERVRLRSIVAVNDNMLFFFLWQDVPTRCLCALSRD